MKNKIFYTSWGYDQTNYDFIIIESVSPSGKTAICRRAKFNTIGQTGQCNIQKPIKEGYGNSFRMKIEKQNDKIYLRGSYIFCGENSKRLDTFSEVDENKTFAETDSMFGH